MLKGLRAIDCDVHPMVPGMAALAPYLDEFWRDQVVERGITSLDSQSWPVRSPKTIRLDWRDEGGRSEPGGLTPDDSCDVDLTKMIRPRPCKRLHTTIDSSEFNSRRIASVSSARPRSQPTSPPSALRYQFGLCSRKTYGSALVARSLTRRQIAPTAQASHR